MFRESKMAGFRGKLNTVEEGGRGAKAGAQVVGLGFPSTEPWRTQKLQAEPKRESSPCPRQGSEKTLP